MAGDPITAKTVDDVFNFDPSDEDPFTDNPITNTRDDKATLSPRAAKRKLDQDRENLGLGLDEEVKITKKRKSIVKLDEARLLSGPGIPRLRAFARSGKIAKKLGFKGKGHEFSDVARLLNYYQLWLDGLYPRAKFADGLQLIEKVGHSKRMNMMRKEWVDEGKPGYIRDQSPTRDDAEQEEMGSKVALQDDTKKDEVARDQGNADNLSFRDSKRAEEDVGRAQPEDDELDALLAENEASMKQASKPLNEDPEGDDDLNALLAEQAARTRPTAITNQESTPIDDGDDLDALLAEQEAHQPSKQVQSAKKRSTMFDESDDEDEDDLDALLAEQEAQRESRPTPTAKEEILSKASANVQQNDGEDANILSSSPLPNDPEEDDVDGLVV